MVDKVQTKSKQVESSLFHFSLIKLLVLKELRKRKREWTFFLSTSWFFVETNSSTPSKGSTPSTNDKASFGSLKSKKGRDKEQQPIVIETHDNKKSNTKGKNIPFTLETTRIEKPKRPLTRSAMKKLIPADEAYPYHEAEHIVEV
jgi:hypothetical protein